MDLSNRFTKILAIICLLVMWGLWWVWLYSHSQMKQRVNDCIIEMVYILAKEDTPMNSIKADAIRQICEERMELE
jgi:hypothetical protein